MKIFITLVDFLMVLIQFIFPVVKEAVTPKPAFEASYTNLGIPLASYYPEGSIARTPWDLTVHDNKLFVAAGDYDVNAGPVPVWYYDFCESRWKQSGLLPDEQIEHFKTINGTLMVPGCDPQGNWDYGNIYVYDNRQWSTLQTVPGGIHQFDLIEYDGKIFAALGVLPGEFPIAVSNDGGKSFHQVAMFKNNTQLDTSVSSDAKFAQIRTYDLFTLNGSLYAYYSSYTDTNLCNEIYRYENDGFYYYCDLPDNLTAQRTTYRPIDTKQEYHGKLYFTTGNLYVTADLKTAQKTVLEQNSIVTDLQVIEDTLYAMTAAKNEDGTYRTAIWCRQKGTKEHFRELFYFNFPCPAQCFTYYEGTMYFGMGDGLLSQNDSLNGTILSVYVLG